MKLLSSRNNRLATIIVAVGFLGLTACNRSPQSGTAEAKQYSLKGTVVSIDKPNSSMVVNGEAIPGFMDAMAMPYKVKNASELDPLAVGDSIAATIVGEKDDYFVRDITVTAHSSAAPAKPVFRSAHPRTRRVGSEFQTGESEWTPHLARSISREDFVGDLYLHALSLRRFLSPRERRVCDTESGAKEKRRPLQEDAPYSASVSIRRMTRPKCCVLTEPATSARRLRSSTTGNSPHRRQTSCPIWRSILD